MPKMLLMLVALVIAALAGVVLTLGYFYSTGQLGKKEFVFGIHTNAFVANTIGDPYQPDNVDRALKLAKKLGVSHLRINYEPYGDEINDDFINRVAKTGIEPVLIVESPWPLHQIFEKENYQSGYNLGKRVASRYQNKIKYFQVANEVSGIAIKPRHPGNKFSDYDLAKYQIMRDWLKGLADGIRAGNPQAQRIVSSNWIATAVIDEIIKDGVEFEIIGWDWFSEMGENPTGKILDDGTVLDIPGHFANSGKNFGLLNSIGQPDPIRTTKRNRPNSYAGFGKQLKTHPMCMAYLAIL